MKIRDYLFSGMKGCSNHGCVIRDNTNKIGTNGTCKCLSNLSRVQLNILQSRIAQISDCELDLNRKQVK